jgi:hypothetical protein
MKDDIACTDFVFRLPDMFEHRVRLRIGRPHEDGSGAWACRVEFEGFEERFANIVGEDSYQALSLAMSFAWLRMSTFVDQGGTILDREGDEYTLDQLRKVLGR